MVVDGAINGQKTVAETLSLSLSLYKYYIYIYTLYINVRIYMMCIYIYTHIHIIYPQAACAARRVSIWGYIGHLQVLI